VVAVNDLGNVENLAYLLKYDSAYGRSNFSVEVREGKLIVGGREIVFLSEKEPTKLPWGALSVDVVVESTGIFEKYEEARMHLEAGAKRVVVTAPMKDEPPEGLAGATVLMGINDGELERCEITSNASCTTNAASPLMQILHESIGIEKALLNTVHGYTATQSLVDSPMKGKDFRRGRAAAHNIVPSTTGAAIAVTKAIPDLAGNFDGIALRVPVITGSIVDVTFVAKRDTSVEEVNSILKQASGDKRWEHIFSATEEQLVSSDIIGSPFASIADLNFTRVTGGNLVKVLAWYDNEMGYTYALVDHVVKLGQHARR
jgi:glyceraldehyde 3-phosphate dehydrogenase